MRRFIFISFFGLATLSACKKSDFKVNNGCISQTRRSFGISAADSLAAVSLLKANNIPYANLVYDRVTLRDTVTNVNDHITSVYQHIDAIQYFNGLPLFNAYIGYHFKEGTHVTTIGNKYNSVDLSITRHLDLPIVRQLFLAAAGEEAATMKDSCLVAEFGYYDLNSSSGSTPPNIIKAWRVTPANSVYPEGFFRDDNGKTLSYFNGIYSF